MFLRQLPLYAFFVFDTIDKNFKSISSTKTEVDSKSRLLSQKKTRVRKMRITTLNKIVDYDSELDMTKNFIESSGTYSYDSAASIKSFERHMTQGHCVIFYKLHKSFVLTF